MNWGSKKPNKSRSNPNQGRNREGHGYGQQQPQYSGETNRGQHHGQHYGYSNSGGAQSMHQVAASSVAMPPEYQDQHLMHGHLPSHMHSSGPQQVHAQESLIRSTQASIQMFYNVYDYTIGMLEELEKHEGLHVKEAQIPENSGIFSHLFEPGYIKPEQDVVSGIEAELQCLSIQIKYSPKEVVTDQTKSQMVEQTFKWLGAREDAGLKLSNVDWYCKNVLEVLVLGQPGEMPPRKRLEAHEISGEEVNEAMFQMAKGRHYGEEQDKQFHSDPNKKAKLRKKRKGGEPREGAFRLKRVCDSLKDKPLFDALDPYMPDAGMDIN